jgi:hypothetical protein
MSAQGVTQITVQLMPAVVADILSQKAFAYSDQRLLLHGLFSFAKLIFTFGASPPELLEQFSARGKKFIEILLPRFQAGEKFRSHRIGKGHFEIAPMEFNLDGLPVVHFSLEAVQAAPGRLRYGKVEKAFHPVAREGDNAGVVLTADAQAPIVVQKTIFRAATAAGNRNENVFAQQGAVNKKIVHVALRIQNRPATVTPRKTAGS